MRRFLLCDLPDVHQPVRDYLNEVERDYPSTSYAMLLGVIETLKVDGPFAADCFPIGGNMWRLTTVIGFGRKANLVFTVLGSGDYFAVHGFTSSSKEEEALGTAIGRARKVALE